MITLNFKLDVHSSEPMYQQIADGIRRQVAIGVLTPGDRLPTVRKLSTNLGVHQNTVFRAYQQLEQDKVIATRRGAGTIVTIDGEDPAIISDRHRRLDDLLHRCIFTLLSLGYSPEEAEMAFHSQLQLWKEERQRVIEVPPDVTEIRKKGR